jgi:hypothetical protein
MWRFPSTAVAAAVVFSLGAFAAPAAAAVPAPGAAETLTSTATTAVPPVPTPVPTSTATATPDPAATTTPTATPTPTSTPSATPTPGAGDATSGSDNFGDSADDSGNAIPVLNPPIIHGAARVGKVFSVIDASWGVANPTLSYQWNRDGEPLAGSTDPTYTVVPADAGEDISVTVTASADGYADSVVTSEVKSIRALDTTVSGNASAFLTNGTSTITYTIAASADGIVPVGDLTVYDNGYSIATATLTSDDNGQVVVKLPKVPGGVNLITAYFAGNEQLLSSSSWPSVVIVY